MNLIVDVRVDFMGQAYTTYGIKGKMDAIGDLIVLAPRDGLQVNEHHPCSTDLNYDGDIWSHNVNQGGRDDYVNYWNTVVKPKFSSYESALRYFYLDEPYTLLLDHGFCASDVSLILSTISTLLKQPNQYPGIPFAVVEAPKMTGQPFTGVDWVGIECYRDDNTCTGSTGTPVSYRTLLDQLEANLTAQQKVLVVPWSAVARPSAYPSWMTTPAEQQAAAARVDYYLNIAMADPKVVGVLPWIGWTFDDGTTLFIGTSDVAGLQNKWRFVMRALGFGYPQ